MFTLDHFPDAAPRYPDKLSVAAPRGTRRALERAAEAEKTTVPDLLRRLILANVAPDLLQQRVV